MQYPGITLQGIKINAMAFADDITLMATCITDLQTLFDIAYKFSKDWQFEFNPSKCVVLNFGTIQPHEKRVKIRMGPHIINTSKCETLLGMSLASEAAQKRIYFEKRIASCQSMCYVTQSLGSVACPLSPKVADVLYNSACLPKLLYGTDVMVIEDDIMDKFESFHASNAKLFQGLPENTCYIGALATGWGCIRSKVDILKIMLILTLPMTSFYKKLVVTIILMLLEISNVLMLSSQADTGRWMD